MVGMLYLMTENIKDKVMTQEEKAQAYDEAREKIALRFGSNVADEIFSQFEMSEDERIRKEIISAIKEDVVDAFEQGKAEGNNELLSKAWSRATITNWYINSVSSKDEPIWTDAHIEELCKDFILIKKGE